MHRCPPPLVRPVPGGAVPDHPHRPLEPPLPQELGYGQRLSRLDPGGGLTLQRREATLISGVQKVRVLRHDPPDPSDHPEDGSASDP